MNRVVQLKNLPSLGHRCISTTSCLSSKKNFRKFYLPNQRGTRAFREAQKTNPHPRIPIETYGVRLTTDRDEHGNMVEVQEKIPEFIVPDLKDFKLKPYVSYRTNHFTQTEFTADDLFNAVYSKKVVDDWNSKQLNEDGSSKKPSPEEAMGPEEAWLRARKTGSDLFGEKPRDTT